MSHIRLRIAARLLVAMLTLVQVTLIVVIATGSALAASPSVSGQVTYDYDHVVPDDAATTAHAAGRGVQFDSTNRGVAGFIYDSPRSRYATNGASIVRGPFGSVGSEVLERAAASGGPTTRIVTSLDSAPAAGRALSVATGDAAEALAVEAGGSAVFTANVPTALITELENIGLAVRSTTSMGGVTGTEIRFLPGASDYIVPFFGGP